MIKITRHDYSSGQSECSSYYVLNGNYINATVKRQLKLLLLESYTHALILVKTRFRFHKHILVFLLVYFNLFFQYLWWGLEHLCAREAVYYQLTSTLPYFQCLFYFINQTFSCLFGMWGHGTNYVAHTWTQRTLLGVGSFLLLWGIWGKSHVVRWRMLSPTETLAGHQTPFFSNIIYRKSLSRSILMYHH